MTYAQTREAFRAAIPAIAAALVSFLAAYSLCAYVGAGGSIAVLAAALCVGLVRRPERLSLRALGVRLIALPLIALGAATAGWLLLRMPELGAAVFTATVALSVALRHYGERAAALGRALALPMLAILVVPVQIDPTVGAGTNALLILAAGAIAMLTSAAASSIGVRLGLLNENAEGRPQPVRRVPAQKGALPVPFRMALQMLAALALAFVIGMLAFPAHWPWVVLSAFIVCSGAVGRGDALYKALLRFGGAVAGTLLAAVAHLSISNSAANAALIFVVLFVGIWLRQINYAYWAACATLIFALLQGANGESASSLFLARVLCIFIGASCGVAATWFVYPIRTKQIIRRRIADALGAMRGVLAGEAHDLEHHAARLERVAPPVRLHRMLFFAKHVAEHPATWIEAAHALLAVMRTPDFDRKHAGEELRRLRSMIVSESDQSRR